MKLWRDIAHIPRDLKDLPLSIKRIVLVVFVYYLAWGILGPFLPIYFKEVLGNYTDATLTIALLYLFSIFWSFPIGDLADKFSKKTLISFFLLLYLPLGPILAVLSKVWQLVIFRFYHSFSATGFWSSGEAYVRTHSPKRKTAESMGVFDAAFGLASVLGAVLGGILVNFYGMRLLFFLIPIFIIGALIFNKKLPDHQGSHRLGLSLKRIFKEGIFTHELGDFWQIKPLVYVTFLSFVFGLAGTSQIVLLPLFSDSLGASPIELGIIFALFSLPILFEAPFSVLADKYSNKKILALTSLLSIFVLVWLFFIESVLILFLLSFLLGLLFAFIFPLLNGTKTKLMPYRKIGELNGVTRSFTLLATGLGILIIGPLADKFSINSPFLVSAGLMFIFLILTLVLWPKIEKHRG